MFSVLIYDISLRKKVYISTLDITKLRLQCRGKTANAMSCRLAMIPLTATIIQSVFNWSEGNDCNNTYKWHERVYRRRKSWWHYIQKYRTLKEGSWHDVTMTLGWTLDCAILGKWLWASQCPAPSEYSICLIEKLLHLSILLVVTILVTSRCLVMFP